jgi:hypothetical protein
MMNRFLMALVLAACGNNLLPPDAPKPICAVDGGAACFQLPTAPLVAHSTTATMPVVLGCGAHVPVLSTLTVTVSGKVQNYTGGTVASAYLLVYGRSDFTTPITSASSDVDGSYTMDLPVGTPDTLFGKIVATGFADIYAANARLDLTMATLPNFNWTTATEAFLDTVFGIVNAVRDRTKAAMAITALDCNGFAIEHAVATVSSTSRTRTFIPGASIFYGAAGTFPVPVRPETRGDTNNNGAIAAFNVPPTGSSFLQIWGFPTAAAQAVGASGLVLIAEYPLTLFAGESVGFSAFANQ